MQNSYQEIRDVVISWIEKISEPNKEIGFPICPFAKKAMRDNKYRIEITTPENFNDYIRFVENHILNWNDEDYEVKLLVSSADLPYEDLNKYCQEKSIELKKSDFFMIPEHKERQVFIKGVQTRLNIYPMIFLQRRSRLNEAYEILKKKDYYSGWDKKTLQEIVQERQ